MQHRNGGGGVTDVVDVGVGEEEAFAGEVAFLVCPAASRPLGGGDASDGVEGPKGDREAVDAFAYEWRYEVGGGEAREPVGRVFADRGDDCELG